MTACFEPPPTLFFVTDIAEIKTEDPDGGGGEGGVVILHSEETIGTDIDPGTGTGGATEGYYQLRLSASSGTSTDHLAVEVKHDDGVAPAAIQWIAKIETVEVNSPLLLSPSPSICW